MIVMRSLIFLIDYEISMKITIDIPNEELSPFMSVNREYIKEILFGSAQQYLVVKNIEMFKNCGLSPSHLIDYLSSREDLNVFDLLITYCKIEE